MVQRKYSTSMAESCEELLLVRRRGGSIIDRRPVFSQDSSFVFVACGCTVRSYNTDNGKPVQDFEGLYSTAAGVHMNPENSDVLVAVSIEGQLVEWEWRISSSPSKVLNINLPMKTRIVSFCLVPSMEDDYIIVAAVRCKNADSLKVADVMLFSGRTGKGLTDFKTIRISDHFRSLATRHHNRETMIAGISKDTLSYAILQDGRTIHEGFKERPVKTVLSSVSCHPNRPCVLVGCFNGHLYLWQNVLTNQPPALFQWHTLPVRDVMFNHTGTSFYSAGDETVVVQWLIESPEKRTYMPRFPAEIVYLALSSTSLISVSTRDNAILITTPGTLKRTVIQHISWTTGATLGCVLPAGIRYTPSLNSLVLNARVGYIQFAQLPHLNSFRMLDVTESNYLIRNRISQGGVMKNTEVIKVEFNSDGHWMATVEHWGGEVNVQPEWRLKFWEYAPETGVFLLNTCIDSPHRGSMNDMKFRPSMASESEMCITCGDDQKFKTWTPVEREGFFMGVTWRPENVGFHRGEPAGPLDFSCDGSLVAIAFGPTLTIWVPKVNDLKCSLTQPEANPEKISHVQFGRESCSHLVVTGSKREIAVWNILSLSLSWVVPVRVRILVADPLSSVMAMFTTHNDIVVFSPNSPDIIHKEVHLLPKGEKVLAAAFIPRSALEMQEDSHRGSQDKTTPGHTSERVASWQSRSQLYFINTKEELLNLVPKVKMVKERELDNIPESSFVRKKSSLFAALQAQDVQSDVKGLRVGRHTKLGIPGFQTLREVLACPAHTMPSPSLLCRPLLMSFISSGFPSLEMPPRENPVPSTSAGVANNDNEDDKDDEEVLDVRKDHDEEMEVDSGAETLSEEVFPTTVKQKTRRKSLTTP